VLSGVFLCLVGAICGAYPPLADACCTGFCTAFSGSETNEVRVIEVSDEKEQVRIQEVPLVSGSSGDIRKHGEILIPESSRHLF